MPTNCKPEEENSPGRAWLEPRRRIAGAPLLLGAGQRRPRAHAQATSACTWSWGEDLRHGFPPARQSWQSPAFPTRQGNKETIGMATGSKQPGDGEDTDVCWVSRAAQSPSGPLGFPRKEDERRRGPCGAGGCPGTCAHLPCCACRDCLAKWGEPAVPPLHRPLPELPAQFQGGEFSSQSRPSSMATRVQKQDSRETAVSSGEIAGRFVWKTELAACDLCGSSEYILQKCSCSSP